MHVFKIMLPFAMAALLLPAVSAVHAADQKDADKNIAVVNGKPISKQRFDIVARSQLQQGQEDTQEFREELREVLITREVLYQEALRQKLDRNPEYLAQLEVVKQQLMLGILFEDFMEKHQPTPETVRQEYERAKAGNTDNSRKEFHSRHILVKEEDEALKIIEQLDQGADFAELAGKHSLDPGSREEGGELGWHEAERFVEPFANALRTLKKGETTGEPVQTSFGFHVIQKVDERPVPFPPFEEVGEQIEQGLISQARDQFVDGLRKNAKIEKIGTME